MDEKNIQNVVLREHTKKCLRYVLCFKVNKRFCLSTSPVTFIFPLSHFFLPPKFNKFNNVEYLGNRCLSHLRSSSEVHGIRTRKLFCIIQKWLRGPLDFRRDIYLDLNFELIKNLCQNIWIIGETKFLSLSVISDRII